MLGKILILARVEAIDPFYDDNPSGERSEVVIFYYSAHYLNSLIFRKHGPLNNCYTFRMHCLNPMTNTPIVNISYFAVESESIGFDDLTDIAESPLLSNLPLNSDLFNESISQIEKSFVVEKYSVPINSDSFSEFHLPIESKSVVFENSSINISDQGSSKSTKSKMVKSETALTTKRRFTLDKLLSRSHQQSLAHNDPSNQISFGEKMERQSTDSLSLFTIFPSHVKEETFSPTSIPSSSRDSSVSENLDRASNASVFGADDGSQIRSSGSIFSQQSRANISSTFTKTNSSSSNRALSAVDSPLSVEVNISKERDESLESDRYSKRTSHLKLTLGSVSEETRRLKISMDLDSDHQFGKFSSRLKTNESLESEDVSQNPFSSSFSELYSREESSFGQPLKFKGLFIGTDDDFLQSPIIRLLFQANSLNCEAAEILTLPDIHIDSVEDV